MPNDRRAFLKTAGSVALSTSLAGLAGRASGAAQRHPKAPPLGVRGSVPGKMLELNGVRYHVGEQGSGDKVVLLLHGMPDTSSVWDYQIPALVAAGYRVVVPDMLGYGETDKPQEPQRYNGELIIGDMLALLETLGVSQVDLVGHDWGAFASWELALNFPDLIRRHVALSVGHPDLMTHVNTVAEAKDSWYMYLNALSGSDQLYAANDGAFLKAFILPTHPELEEVWSRLKEPAAMNGMLNWDRANPMSLAYLGAFTRQVAPRKCQVPTLGLWSSGDTYLWETQMQDSQQLMAAPWHYARVEEASHWFMLEQPQQVNKHILDWLQAS